MDANGSNGTTVAKNTGADQVTECEVAIVGAGFGGMGAAIQLQRMGINDVVILDRADDLGGTWHLNTYPGLAVDIASTTYSYSFELNPHWSRVYAKGAELKAYAAHVADKYDLRKLMRFGSDVQKVVYDEKACKWTVHTKGQKPLRAHLLILATGFLSQPKMPDIPGLDSFEGKLIHTARWDHDYELRGKRAAVIGTGATAVQLLPEIAPLLQQMDVYQRTPIWVTPKFDTRIPPAVQTLFEKLPFTQRLARYFTSTILEMLMVVGALHFKEFKYMTRSAERMALSHLRRQVPDKELRKKLTPDYNFGCKRPTFSNDYYPTFMRENVELITDGIDHIERDGIVDRNGKKREIDALILATGYKVWEKGNFPAFDVVGRGGVELGQWWNENGYQSYEGITVSGFPNLFYFASPYAFTGLSYFFAIEAQMKHVGRCISEMKRRGADEFEVRRSAQTDFVTKMKKNLKSSVFENGQCATSNSYYFNQHGDSTLLRPTPTALSLWNASRYPLGDYVFA